MGTCHLCGWMASSTRLLIEHQKKEHGREKPQVPKHYSSLEDFKVKKQWSAEYIKDTQDNLVKRIQELEAKRWSCQLCGREYKYEVDLKVSSI